MLHYVLINKKYCCSNCRVVGKVASETVTAMIEGVLATSLKAVEHDLL